MKINSGTIGAITILVGLAIVWVIYWLVMQQAKQKVLGDAGAGTVGMGVTGIGSTAQLATSSGLYIVRSGDTLKSIALKYGKAVNVIAILNGFNMQLVYPDATALAVKGVNPNLLYIGQSLKV